MGGLFIKTKHILIGTIIAMILLFLIIGVYSNAFNLQENSYNSSITNNSSMNNTTNLSMNNDSKVVNNDKTNVNSQSNHQSVNHKSDISVYEKSSNNERPDVDSSGVTREQADKYGYRFTTDHGGHYVGTLDSWDSNAGCYHD